MFCSVEELFRKNVINIDNGCSVGYISDMEIDTCKGVIKHLCVSDYDKLIRIKKNDFIEISWENIVIIGNDSVLVTNISPRNNKSNQPKGIFNIFSK